MDQRMEQEVWAVCESISPLNIVSLSFNGQAQYDDGVRQSQRYLKQKVRMKVMFNLLINK